MLHDVASALLREQENVHMTDTSDVISTRFNSIIQTQNNIDYQPFSTKVRIDHFNQLHF